jgi:CDGSH-type Zn-finger protein
MSCCEMKLRGHKIIFVDKQMKQEQWLCMCENKVHKMYLRKNG